MLDHRQQRFEFKVSTMSNLASKSSVLILRARFDNFQEILMKIGLEQNSRIDFCGPYGCLTYRSINDKRLQKQWFLSFK